MLVVVVVTTGAVKHTKFTQIVDVDVEEIRAQTNCLYARIEHHRWVVSSPPNIKAKQTNKQT